MTEALPRKFESSDALCRYVADLSGDTALVSFSCGKDAIASWFQCKRYFRRLVPFYLYCVPGLRFVEEGVRYFEERLGTPILRLPHPGFVRMLRNMVFQTPESVDVLKAASLPKLTIEQVEARARTLAGAPNAYVAIGSRAADSVARRCNIKHVGSCSHTRRSFMPVFDWLMDDVVDCIKRENLRLPVDYRLFGRTFDGLDYRFIEPLRREYPDDYERLKTWFPLIELEIYRREMKPRRAA